MRSDWLLPICSGGERVKDGGAKAHPTQKPEALLYRVLLACTNPGDVVLDPFFGTGTTGAVARRLAGTGSGSSASSATSGSPASASTSTLELDESAMKTMASKRSQPRVPFGALVETGMIHPGTMLTDSKRRWQARVGADASIEMDGEPGSIHRIGALAQGAPACNGWAFWHFEEGGALAPLDALRQRYLLTLD